MSWGAAFFNSSGEICGLADYDHIREAVGGDNFTEGTLNIEWFEAALQLAEQHQRDEIIIKMTENDIQLGC